MDDPKHTPGPWTVGTKHPGRVFSQHFHVAFTTMPQDEGTETEEEKANARLIAAAPAMLSALKRLLLEELQNDITPACDEARAAIAQAEETP